MAVQTVNGIYVLVRQHDLQHASIYTATKISGFFIMTSILYQHYIHEIACIVYI